MQKKLTLLAEGKKENPCRRQDGSWHYWKVFQVEVEGEVKPSKEETKQVVWLSKTQIIELCKKTKAYLNGDIKEAEWEKSPGLEPVSYDWFLQLK